MNEKAMRQCAQGREKRESLSLEKQRKESPRGREKDNPDSSTHSLLFLSL